MSLPKRMRLYALKQSTVGHTAVGLWRHPECQAARYTDLDYWTSTAQTLEEGCFDGLFIADALGVLDVYGGTADETLRHGVQTPTDDPLLTISAMAAATRHLGFAVTVSTSYELPYALARKMTTLDHLTKGRIGWNVVTSALESAARNLGLTQQIPHDERYVVAEEFMEVVYGLWEASWQDGAVVADRRRGVFVDPTRVRRIAHRGKYFHVPDFALSEPSVQRTPALFQAGTSTAGRAFAARHAEGVFLSVPKASMARPLVADIKAKAAAAGRDPADLKFIAMAAVVVAPTDAQAQEKHREYLSYISVEGHLARHSALLQLDLSKVGIDTPLEYVDLEGIRSTLEVFTRLDPTRQWTPRQMAQSLGLAAGGPTFVGSPSTVADEMERWLNEGDLDGFNILDPMPLCSYPEFVQWVVPELQQRGRVWREYAGATLREYLQGAGQKRARSTHPAGIVRESWNVKVSPGSKDLPIAATPPNSPP
jgi:FMN-dependent oxidoreductase (nitrilotriacetate monooxygenase family)